MGHDATLRHEPETTLQDGAESREGNDLYQSSRPGSEAVEIGPANEWVSDGLLIDRTIAVAPKGCRQFLAHSPR